MKINYSNPQSAAAIFLFIAFFISGFSAFSQTTAIPDDNFEQALIDLGIDSNGKNGNILNSDAVAVDTLQIPTKNIANLSGIEAFTSLTSLNCWGNQLTSLDISTNTALTSLNCNNNKLASLDVSSNTVLTDLSCFKNNLTNLDVSKNTTLTELSCGSNQLTSLDVSVNKKLTRLLCTNSQLTSLNVKNENNASLFINVFGNPNLNCIQVDDASNIPSNWFKDATAVYSEDCSALSNKDFKLAEVSILPNPTSGVLNITSVEKADYRLFNIKGQILKKGVLENKIDISSLSKGIYLLNLKTNKGSFTKKVVRN